MASLSSSVLASNVMYDLSLGAFGLIVHVFFREVRTRGAHNIPKEGPIIFAAGPHANQFLDLILALVVREASGRRVSFLVAEHSMKRQFIGLGASIFKSIPVARAADNAVKGAGTLYMKSSDEGTIIYGRGTKFTDSLQPKKQIMLGKEYGFPQVEVVEVLDDERVKVKKEFSSKPKQALLEAEEEGKGLAYKILPHIDQSQMYGQVYKQLKEGGSIGIFPEGGSHDRTDLLPLKAGVSLMALGAMANNEGLNVKIVPVGLSYFHPHKFRSRAVVEFGHPIEIPAELVNGYKAGGDEKRKATGGVMDLVLNGLKSVTVRADDYETLMLIQATRRLYVPPGQHPTLGQVVDLNRRFITGYEVYKDHPRVKKALADVQRYNKELAYMGLKDHQVESANRPAWKSLVLLLYRTGLLTVWGVLALPGVVLNAPMFIAAKVISHRKAKEALAASTVKLEGRDVLATWKVLVSLGIAPPLYGTYVAIATYIAFRYNWPLRWKIWTPILTILALPTVGYSALKFGEVGMDIYKSLAPLTVSLMPGNSSRLQKLREMRRALQFEVNEIITTLGPTVFDNFEKMRLYHPPTSNPEGRGRSDEKNPLRNPMSWMDDRIFGWSSGSGSGEKRLNGADGEHSEASEGEMADYDEAINVLDSYVPRNSTSRGSSESGRRRRFSRSRSRSGGDLKGMGISGMAKVKTD
ncbi:hypothetical protein BT69DRAFT_1356523 [Atractiella rhizophila]|nr:hypothetical protein BT69DRAFT_1356523 [Atractiella rhizophila]